MLPMLPDVCCRSYSLPVGLGSRSTGDEGIAYRRSGKGREQSQQTSARRQYTLPTKLLYRPFVDGKREGAVGLDSSHASLALAGCRDYFSPALVRHSTEINLDDQTHSSLLGQSDHKPLAGTPDTLPLVMFATPLRQAASRAARASGSTRSSARCASTTPAFRRSADAAGPSARGAAFPFAAAAAFAAAAGSGCGLGARGAAGVGYVVCFRFRAGDRGAGGRRRTVAMLEWGLRAPHPITMLTRPDLTLLLFSSVPPPIPAATSPTSVTESPSSYKPRSSSASSLCTLFQVDGDDDGG
ncbi:hypothetical protein BDK51DRAFT_43639 [Blyttiomyces helicus]|uniref:Uncharacterized protein n=1 Tax=Blyttiomyces helicus TaxID=388810 RepID=A0A4P9WGS3_9FUNG|nr:hypothetical protein BDK51DRAFT_43639 [Blyttiomyces helicus]|eukprot:RKO90578.1 hypothetical protein BDK51DRAFT_43639 [Blyttiomyces helicus]